MSVYSSVSFTCAVETVGNAREIAYWLPISSLFAHKRNLLARRCGTSLSARFTRRQQLKLSLRGGHGSRIMQRPGSLEKKNNTAIRRGEGSIWTLCSALFGQPVLIEFTSPLPSPAPPRSRNEFRIFFQMGQYYRDRRWTLETFVL